MHWGGFEEILKAGWNMRVKKKWRLRIFYKKNCKGLRIYFHKNKRPNVFLLSPFKQVYGFYRPTEDSGD